MTGNKEITLYFCKILLYWQGRQETTQQSCVKDIKFILPQYLVLALSLAVAAEDKRQTVDARVVNLTFLSLWGTTGHRLNNGLCSRLLLPRSIVYQTTQSVYSATYHPQYWEQSSTLSLLCSLYPGVESGGNFVPPTYFDYKELVIAAKWSKSAFFIQIFSHIYRHRKS